MHMKPLKKLLSITAAVCILLASFPAAALDVTSYGACVMDCESGEILFSKDGQTARVPASMTKIMTLYLLFERLAAGDITKSSAVGISAKAAAQSYERGASNIPLRQGDFYSIEEMIDALVVPSACAAGVAVAEFLCGSEEAFVRRMNEKGSEMGLTAYFADTSGLSDSNRISPESVAVLVRNFILNYPDILNYTKKTGVYIRGKYYKATNLLLKTDDKHYFPEADGFKTGTTSIAGKCIAATAVRGGTRIITVTMHSSTNDSRYTDTKKMLESGFEQMTTRTSNVFSTDIRAFVNGTEIPCCYYLGRQQSLLIIAENLRSYGFDVNYTAEDNTLRLEYCGGAAAGVQLPERKTPGTALYPIYQNSGLRVAVIKNGVTTYLKTVYSLNGQCCISPDELGALYERSWSDETRQLSITAA